MAGFVFGHFVNAVVNGVVAEFLGQRGNLLLAVAGTEFCCRAHFNVLFRRVGNDFAQHLGDACGMVCFLKSIALEGFGNFRIAFAVGLAAHRQIHADFAAFAGEVFAQAGNNAFVQAFGNADSVFIGISLIFFVHNLKRFGAADRTYFRHGVAFDNLSADCANVFHYFFVLFKLFQTNYI